MVADVTFHDLDSHNPHAHIMLTMRNIDEKGFSLKKNRNWNKRELLEKQRSAWAISANYALEKAGVKEKIDHRTLEAQGINRIPQIHLGAAVTAMMKRGISTDKEERYREIAEANRNIRKWSFHLELLEQMESIYRNSPELDPTNDLSQSTQPVPLAPTIESQPLTQSPQTTIEQLTEPSQAFEKTTQLDSVSSEQSSEPEIPIESMTRQQLQQVIKTASRFLHFIGQSVWDSDQGYYHLMTNRKDLLVIRAKDHRGEILRYQDGKITTQGLTSEDVDKFLKINALLEQKLQELKADKLSKHREPDSELEL